MRDKTKDASIILHLEEIRRRIIICLLALGITSIISFIFIEKIMKLLLLPAGDIQLIYINPAEALIAYIRITILFGIILAMPVFLAQFFAYVLPALYKNEKKVFVPTVLATLTMFVLGVAFSYKIAFPFTIKFFLQFASSDLIPMFTITEYTSFSAKFLLLFGVVFQLPLLFVILGSMNIVNVAMLTKSRGYVIILLAIVSAVMTPPDAISQLMVLVPLWILFEIGILLVRIIQFKKGRKS